ncbi:MAG: hypothetical protein ACD_41C00163G0002 [uncultured bacterium]|nr:MAG: hypothetical protein ACD_41C00163G0002 [uncultured bacterium]HBY74197.1 hypothetical protein [Candidatus Kerfeldbacteria bacterium]
MKKILVCIAFSFALAQTAEATGTFYVDADAGNDANNCTSADTACLTIAGAKALIVDLADPSNTTLKLKGTFTDQVSFANTDVTKPDTLDGLRVTATDQSNQPVINTSVAATAAISIVNINSVTVDHLTITGGTKGVYVVGSGGFIQNISIHDNDISGVSSTTTSSGIELTYAKSGTIRDNTIHDMVATVTDVSYTYVYGIYVLYGYDIAIRQNTISNVGINSTLAATTSHVSYVYGLYLSSVTDGIVKQNTLSDVFVTETATLADTNQTTSVFGFNGSNLFDVAVSNNTFTNLTSTMSADVDGNYCGGAVYGLLVSDLRPDDGVGLINKNTIDTVTSTQTCDSGSPTAQGMNIQYAFGATAEDNTIQHITTSHTANGADVSVGGSATGISGPFYGSTVTLSQNVISDVGATAVYSGADSSSNVTVRGIYQYVGSGSIVGNTISNLSISIDNNDAAGYYDYATLYGIDSSFADNVVLKNNTIKQTTFNYATAGVDGTTLLYLYGLSIGYADGAVIQKNTVKDVEVATAATDATDASYVSMNTYGFFFNRLPNAVIRNNRLQRFSISGDAGNANDLYNYVQGINLNSVSGTIHKNRIVNADVTSTIVADAANQFFYAIAVSTQSSQTAITDNIVRDITTTTSGIGTSNTVMGINVSYGPDLILTGNQIRPFTSTVSAGEALGHYGIYFSSDASHARILDNMLLGNATAATTVSTGVYLLVDSTVDVDMIHNTITDWEYPVRVDGGNKIYLRNNILAAVGADSYALAIGRDTMNNDTFKSDYNLLYNATVAEQLVYDTDNTLAILLADWTNVGGSYGYDVNSINKIPKINALGRLQKGSKAINAGSKDYPYTKGDAELTYLATDINGTKRPIDAKKKKVDIGADEYKK